MKNKQMYLFLVAALLLAVVLFLGIKEKKPTVIEEKKKDISTMTIYHKNGSSLLIAEESFSEYDNGDWGKEPFKVVYSGKGEEKYIPESEYNAYLADGWYEEMPDHEGLYDLKAEIESYIKTQNGSWGVFIQDLSDYEYLLINEDRYSAASLVKIYTMATTYSEIEKGNLEKNSDISHRLNIMITESSNDACNYLTIKNGGGNEATGFDRENEVSLALGCENTERGSYLVELSGRKGPYRHHNYTSPRDCGRVLKAIYEGELISEEASSEMLELLLNQTRRWKIPAGVPAGTKVANKTGETDTANSDVAIVFSPGGDYIICVLGNGNVANGVDTIRKISGMAYDYFN